MLAQTTYTQDRRHLTPATTAQQRRHAQAICDGATASASKRIADALAFASTGCECAELSMLNRAILENDIEFLEIAAPDLLRAAPPRRPPITPISRLNDEIGDYITDRLNEGLADLYDQMHATDYGDYF